MAGIDSFTKLCLHLNTNFIDSSDFVHIVTPRGGAVIVTVQKKFGVGSSYFDGEADYLEIEDSEDWYFGNGNFTIDFQARFAVKPSEALRSQHFFNQLEDGDNAFYFGFSKGDGGLQWLENKTGEGLQANYVAAWDPPADTWFHIALVRNGSSVYIFVDGVPLTIQERTAVGTKTLGDKAAPLNIGQDPRGGSFMNGWIDEYRVSKGIARWISDFSGSLPTEEYSGVVPPPPAPPLEMKIVQYSGYHAFMSQFIKNSRAGNIPLKTPDGINKCW